MPYVMMGSLYVHTWNIHTRFMDTVNKWNTCDIKHLVPVKTNGNWSFQALRRTFSHHPVIDTSFRENGDFSPELSKFGSTGVFRKRNFKALTLGFFSSLCHLWSTILALIQNILMGTVFNFFVSRLINCGEKLSQYTTFQVGHQFYVEIKETLTFFTWFLLLICMYYAKILLSLLLLRLVQNQWKTDYFSQAYTTEFMGN